MTDLDLTAFYGQFRDEAWENLNLLEQGLTTLESQPDDTALLDRMLRAIHTTKGSAKILGFTEINRLAHRMEDVLGALRKGTLALSPEVGTALLKASAGIRALTTRQIEGQGDPVDAAELVATMQRLLGVKEPTPETAPVVTVTAAAAGRPRETMRVDLELVDRLASLIGETLTLQQQALQEQRILHELALFQEETARGVNRLKQSLEGIRNRLRPRQATEVFQHIGWLETQSQQMSQQWRDFGRRHATLLERFSLTLAEVHRQTLAVRMVPIGTLFEIFPSVMRRMAVDCGVEVSLQVRGVDVELDRRVLDQLRDPLIHLVRNALSHGVEPPEERVAQGKHRRGQVILEASQRGRRVQVCVQDDGRGIDIEKVRRAAVDRGLMNKEQAQEADDETLIDLLFRPTFSTRKRASDMSGRGVGLDVVQTTMRQLNGFVQVRTEAHAGTTFVLDVPLTLATARVLLVESAGEILAIPTANVQGLVRVRPEEVVPVEGRPTLSWHGHALSLIALSDTLGLPATHVNLGIAPAIVVGTNGYQAILTVDRLLDEAEVVVRPLGEILGKSPYFSAATLSGIGQVIPIVDLTNLLSDKPRAFRSAERAQTMATPAPRSALILLVEDAITTRELERSILEAAGYRVETAFDGVDALQKLERNEFQIIITDVEMPRMDGFQLTARVRQDPRWADLPVVIVSAREDENSRRQGLQAGAQAYIAKSRFDQSNLLETIAQLVG